MKTLIKNGTLVTAEKTFQVDILIQDEKIQRISSGLEADSASTIDASGKLILPGGVDPHVHLDLPMFEHPGFGDAVFDACTAFFRHYGLEPPVGPLLEPELSSPLFLRVLCETMKIMRSDFERSTPR